MRNDVQTVSLLALLEAYGSRVYPHSPCRPKASSGIGSEAAAHTPQALNLMPRCFSNNCSIYRLAFNLPTYAAAAMQSITRNNAGLPGIVSNAVT
jgi:hypothetical protein